MDINTLDLYISCYAHEVNMKRFLNIKLLAIDVIHRNRYNNPVPKKLHFYDNSINTPMGWKNCNIKIGRLVFCD